MILRFEAIPFVFIRPNVRTIEPRHLSLKDFKPQLHGKELLKGQLWLINFTMLSDGVAQIVMEELAKGSRAALDQAEKKLKRSTNILTLYFT